MCEFYWEMQEASQHAPSSECVGLRGLEPRRVAALPPLSARVAWSEGPRPSRRGAWEQLSREGA